MFDEYDDWGDDDAEAYELDQLAQDHEGEGDYERDHDYIRELSAFEAMDPALAIMAEAQIGFSSDVYLYT